MMTEPLSGAGYNWTATGAGGTNTLAMGAAAITWSTGIPVFPDTEQVGLLVLLSSAVGTQFVLRWQWGTTSSSFLHYEVIESPGAVVDGFQRYDLFGKEWGPIAGIVPGLGMSIARPSCFPFFRVGVYTVGAVDPADTVQVTITRQRGAQLQAAGS